MTPPAIRGLLVVSHVGGFQVLYLMLGANGTIHRLGDGTESGAGQDLFIGWVAGNVFAHASRLAAPVLSGWLGEFRNPHPAGVPRRLTIGFRLEDGTEHVSEWEYGSDSQGPPPEVADFVQEVLRATEPWYQEQLRLAQTQVQ